MENTSILKGAYAYFAGKAPTKKYLYTYDIRSRTQRKNIGEKNMEKETLDVEKKEAGDNVKKPIWVADPTPPSNIINLDVGNSVVCTIMGRVEVPGMHGTKQMKYDLQIVGESESRPLYASTDLKPRLALHNIGDLIKIERVDDAERTSPEKNPMHQFVVYSPKE